MSQKKCCDFEWPKDNLDHVKSCPVCGCQKNELFLDNLIDNAFFVAPGKWKLYQCQQCSSAYLNPRPDSKSIGSAYGSYYTHEAPIKGKDQHGNLGIIKRLRRQLVNGYYNYHYGTKREPSTRLGGWVLFLYPKFLKRANAMFRYLKKPSPGQKLLDVGCGNGDYLMLAAEAGWEVKGVEPDPKAFEVARSRGLDIVQGSIEEIIQTGELFDAITMSHVIEHVHDPAHFVKKIHQSLKPGGILYIDTPNIQSSGARRFRKNWRGIESPRHLILFSELGLRTILQEAGFSNLVFFPRQEVRRSIALKSYRMEQGLSPYNGTLNKMPFKDKLRCYVPRRYDREEFLTLLANKD